MTDARVILAAVAGAHGVGGEVRLKLFAEGLASLKRHKTMFADDRPLTVKSVRPGGGGAIARFAEIEDRAAAEALRGTVLSVSRADLPPLRDGEYYHADLLGLPCVDSAGAPLGTVVAVESYGAGDLLEIERPDGRRALIPFRTGMADLQDDRIVADPAFLA